MEVNCECGDKMFNIAVIGCGVIGLTSALSIQRKFKNAVTITIFSKQFSPNTTGDLSAGLWTPYLVQNTPNEKVIRWSQSTKDYLLKLWREGKAKDYGISFVPMIYLTDNEDFEIPEWTDVILGFHKLTKEELRQFSNKHKKRNIKHGFSFVTIIWEPKIFLPVFEKEFKENGGIIKRREILDLQEVENFDIVLNCTGLNSKYLVNDNLMIPIRGQIMRVNAPWMYQVFMLDFGIGNYIIPNTDSVILGGTHQDGDYSREVDEADADHIIKGCSEFVPALKFVDVVRHGVGLRPGRERVRLELEHRVNSKGHSVYIIHNYGHGGCGVTLAIGCADDASELVRKVMNMSKNKL